MRLENPLSENSVEGIIFLVVLGAIAWQVATWLATEYDYSEPIEEFGYGYTDYSYTGGGSGTGQTSKQDGYPNDNKYSSPEELSGPVTGFFDTGSLYCPRDCMGYVGTADGGYVDTYDADFASYQPYIHRQLRFLLAVLLWALLLIATDRHRQIYKQQRQAIEAAAERHAHGIREINESDSGGAQRHFIVSQAVRQYPIHLVFFVVLARRAHRMVPTSAVVFRIRYIHELC